MSKHGPIYLAIIGDLIDSREIPDRAKTQENLSHAFEEIGLSGGLCSPYTITLGDEFQAVYETGEQLFQHLLKIRLALYPVRTRFSLALGVLSTPINSKQAIGMDGPAFYEARDGIEVLRQKGQFFRVGGLPADVTLLVESAATLLAHITEGWNPNRLQILLALLAQKEGGRPEYDLDISHRAINKNISEAQLTVWKVFLQEAEARLTLILRGEGENTSAG